MERTVKNKVAGSRVQEGAGVHITRVLGAHTAADFDPFLLLDVFDSTDPDEYTKGFPMHPHRGIETISYLISGKMLHKDILGNEGVLNAGEAQRMTAGSGIMHEEMPQRTERMFGLQLWLNLPKKQKMMEPAYHSIRPIPEIHENGAAVRVVSGRYKSAEGFQDPHLPAELYDIGLPAGTSFSLAVNPEYEVYFYVFEGSFMIGDEICGEKTAVSTTEGDTVVLKTLQTAARVFMFSARRLNEPIAWGGPVVMNTDQELRDAFLELEEGRFIKQA